MVRVRVRPREWRGQKLESGVNEKMGVVGIETSGREN